MDFKKIAIFKSMFFNGFNRMYFNETELRKALDDYDVNMSVKPVIHREKRWNLWGGLYYAGTIYTTIGYGDMVAVTFWGRVLTMFYASIGIPLVITILNDWGTVMFHVADELWKDIVIPVIHILKKSLHSESYSGSQEGNYDRFTQTSSSELPNDSDAIQPMPLFLVVVVLAFWIVLCCAVFLLFENWTFFEAFYFFFISLTTIGFGDITPRHTVAVANFLLILVGLSVVSMAINVVQMQLEFLFSRIVKLIDKDFKASLCVSTDEMKKVTYEADDVQSISSMVQQQKDQDVIKQYTNEMKASEKLLMRFMSHHQKKLLNEKFESRAKMRNKSTQTSKQIKIASVQTGKYDQLPYIPEEEEESKEPKSRVTTKRLYIYNTGE